jgi:MFS family permease
MDLAKMDFDHIESTAAVVQVTSGTSPWQDTADSVAHGDDPVNWSLWKKYYIVILMSSFTLVAQLGSAMIFPSFVEVAEDLHVTVEEASYCVTIFMLVLGIFPLMVVPFSQIYRRRPLYIIFTPLSVAGFVISAISPLWGGLIAGRVISAIGCSIPLGIGAVTICDLFAQGDRGLPMGIYAWATTNSSHIAPIAGGYIAKDTDGDGATGSQQPSKAVFW